MTTVKENPFEISDQEVSKHLDMSLEFINQYFPTSYLECARLNLKIKQFLRSKDSGNKEEILYAEQNLGVQPPIDTPRPNNLAELKDWLNWTYYFFVKGKLTVMDVQRTIVLTDIILKENKCKQEIRVSEGGDPIVFE